MAPTPFDMNNLNELEEDENEESPRSSGQIMSRQETSQNMNQESESNGYYGFEEEGYVQEP